MENCIEILKNQLNLEIDDDGISKVGDEIYAIDAINIDSNNEEFYLIYDFTERNAKFDLNNIRKNISEYSSYTLIMFFESWDDERNLYWSEYEKLGSANEKKYFKQIFDLKISLYTGTGTDKELEFNLKNDGINYLEYIFSLDSCGPDPSLTGKIFNLSFYELKKLFNITGIRLFNNNVRFGSIKDSSNLGVRFKNYILFGINKKLEKLGINNTSNSLILEDNIENREITYHNDIFWFCHNGITIYSYNEISFKGSKIRLSPNSVSVINGAQTLTRFFDIADKIKRDYLKDVNNKSDDFDIEKTIEEIFKKIFVKTIFIYGDKGYIKPITYGLNTQIPIQEETRLANSDIISDINKHFNNRIKIIKEGEYFNGLGYTPINFAKNWLTINSKPGESKNYNKINITDLFEEIKETINEENYDVDELIEKMYCLNDVYLWWDASKKTRLKNTEKGTPPRTICSYAKNYFGFFVSLSYNTNEPLDDDKITSLYINFEKELLALEYDELTLGDFKKDVLSKLLEDKLLKDFESNKKEIDSLNNMSEILNDKEIDSLNNMSEILNDKDKIKPLINLLNDKDQSPYSFKNTIDNFISSNGKILSYYRVISLENEKAKEYFHFPNRTFNEIYDMLDNDSTETSYKEYEDSLFYKEIQKEYPVIILNKEMNKSNSNKIRAIKFIPKFSFKKFNVDAKDVYDKTVTAFKDGDESKFPKISDNLKFHIRPKATNAEDTFVFTNGNHITKQTFWANKETVEEIISDNSPKDN